MSKKTGEKVSESFYDTLFTVFEQEIERYKFDAVEIELLNEIFGMIKEDKVKKTTISEMVPYALEYYKEKMDDVDEDGDDVLFLEKYRVGKTILSKIQTSKLDSIQGKIIDAIRGLDGHYDKPLICELYRICLDCAEIHPDGQRLVSEFAEFIRANKGKKISMELIPLDIDMHYTIELVEHSENSDELMMVDIYEGDESWYSFDDFLSLFGRFPVAKIELVTQIEEKRDNEKKMSKVEGEPVVNEKITSGSMDRIVKITLEDSNYDPKDSAGIVTIFAQTTKSDDEIKAVFDEIISKYENYAEENGGEEIFWAEIPRMVADKIGTQVFFNEIKREC